MSTPIGQTLVEPQGRRAQPDYFLQNDKIDRRLGRGSPHRGSLKRGRMVRRGVGTRELKGILHFLFNPTKVDFSYDIDETALIEALKLEPNQAPRLGPSAACSFQLVFDRTYETLDNDFRGRTDAAGVLQDVQALEHIMGINSRNGVIAPPQAQPVDVYFGDDNAMRFGGFFSSASVSMTHFNPRMIPTRLVMNISLLKTKEVAEVQEELARIRGSAGDPWSGNFGTPSTPPAPPRPAATEPSTTRGAAGDPWSSSYVTPTPPRTPTRTTGGGGGSRLL